MSLLTDMENECECIEAFYQEYIQNKHSDIIFLYFEGKDDYKYYLGKLSTYRNGREIRKYDCNGKQKVVELHNMISKHSIRTTKGVTLFFVDKDYDVNNDFSEDIYVTPTYAIENFYISDSAFKNFLIGEWGLSSNMNDSDRDDFEKALNYFRTERTRIIESMIYANAWYSLQKKKSKGKKNPPKLSAIKEYKNIKDIRDKNILHGMVPFAIAVSEEEIVQEIDYLNEAPVERIRGKYFEQTMYKVFEKIIQEGNKSVQTEFNRKHSINLNVGKDNMISILSNYADVPNCLAKYIYKRLGIPVSV